MQRLKYVVTGFFWKWKSWGHRGCFCSTNKNCLLPSLTHLPNTPNTAISNNLVQYKTIASNASAMAQSVELWTLDPLDRESLPIPAAVHSSVMSQLGGATFNPLRANYCHTWQMENHPFIWRRIRRVRRIQVCMARKGLSQRSLSFVAHSQRLKRPPPPPQKKKIIIIMKFLKAVVVLYFQTGRSSVMCSLMSEIALYWVEAPKEQLNLEPYNSEWRRRKLDIRQGWCENMASD